MWGGYRTYCISVCVCVWGVPYILYKEPVCVGGVYRTYCISVCVCGGGGVPHILYKCVCVCGGGGTIVNSGTLSAAITGSNVNDFLKA